MPEAQIDHEEALLIAYLDGEVDSDTRRELEARLALEPGLRKRLQVLEESWQALDLLEVVQVDKDLVRTTMELLVVTTEKELEEHLGENSPEKKSQWLQTLVGMVIAATFVYAVLSLVLPNPNRQLMKDLPIIERLDEYQVAPDVEFLRKLDESGIFETE